LKLFTVLGGVAATGRTKRWASVLDGLGCQHQCRHRQYCDNKVVSSGIHDVTSRVDN
jgi:hypothetical protein